MTCGFLTSSTDEVQALRPRRWSHLVRMSLGWMIGWSWSIRVVLVLLIVVLPLPALWSVPLVRRFCEPGYLVSIASSPGGLDTKTVVRALYLLGVVQFTKDAGNLFSFMVALSLPLFFVLEPLLSCW